MVKCSVPGCNSTDSSKGFLFSFPTKMDLLQKWLDAIPGLEGPVKRSWRVCRKHFEREDIIDNFCHTVGGELIKIERERPRLRPNAVPTKNLHATEKVEITAMKIIKLKEHEVAPKQIKIKRKRVHQEEEEDIPCSINSISEGPNVATEVYQSLTDDELAIYTRVLDCEDSEEAVTETSKKNVSQLSEEDEAPFENLFDNVFEVVLPSTLWGVHRSTNQTRIMFVCIDEDELNISKMLTVDNKGNLKIYISSDVIRDYLLPADILTTEHISDLLTELDTM